MLLYAYYVCRYNEVLDHSSLLNIRLNPDNFLKKVKKITNSTRNNSKVCLKESF